MPEPESARHPGEILAESYLEARSISQYRLAVDTGVPPRRINEIVLGKRGITADTALRLARYFGNDPLYWMELQARWELHLARLRLGPKLDADVRIPTPEPPDSPPRRRPRRQRRPPTPAPQPEPSRDLADHLL